MNKTEMKIEQMLAEEMKVNKQEDWTEIGSKKWKFPQAA